MGLFIRQNENRSQLQERLAAELREKAKLQASATEPLDQTEKSNYIKDTEQLSGRSWLKFALIVVLVLGVVVFAVTR